MCEWGDPPPIFEWSEPPPNIEWGDPPPFFVSRAIHRKMGGNNNGLARVVAGLSTILLLSCLYVCLSVCLSVCLTVCLRLGSAWGCLCMHEFNRKLVNDWPIAAPPAV